MRTIEIYVYRFAELEAKTQEKVIADWKNSQGYLYFDSASKSLLALIRHLGGNDTTVEMWLRYLKTLDFENEKPIPADVMYCFPDADKNPTRQSVNDLNKRLAELGSYNPVTLRGHGECKLTGECYDEYAIDGARIAIMQNGNYNSMSIVFAAFENWYMECCKEMAHFYSLSAFTDFCEANNYEFYVDGKLCFERA